MESANLHHQHHQLQGQLVIPSSSLLTSPSTYGATATASPHAWTQNFTLSSSSTGAAGNLNFPNCNGVSLNQRQKNERIVSPLNNSMIHQDLSFNWNQSTHHDLQQLSKIKQELSSSDSFPKFTDMLNTTSSSSIDQEDSSSPTSCYIKDDQKDHNITDLSENLLLKTISSGFPINVHHQFSPPQIFSSFGSSIPSRGNFSQIYPSINISNLNRSPPTSISLSNSFDINLQALDLLTSTRFSASFGHPSHHNDNLAIYNGLDRVQQSTHHMQSCSPSKVSSFTTNELTEAKRPNNSLMEPKATQAAPKKSRLESRASCPPFKVRKEKLGDRIAALQQLVAPFGKTDTASVLMEAIGYIKFLQNQVETLSVPYMKSSRNKTSTRTTQAFQGSTVEEGNYEAKKDLRSRGLCLVPLSCMSYVTGDGNGGTGGGGIWPPPNFGGGT